MSVPTLALAARNLVINCSRFERFLSRSSRPGPGKTSRRRDESLRGNSPDPPEHAMHVGAGREKIGHHQPLISRQAGRTYGARGGEGPLGLMSTGLGGIE